MMESRLLQNGRPSVGHLSIKPPRWLSFRQSKGWSPRVIDKRSEGNWGKRWLSNPGIRLTNESTQMLKRHHTK